MIATLEARDHGLGHTESLGELPLGLAGMGPKLEQALGAARGERLAVVAHGSLRASRTGRRHGAPLSKIANRLSTIAKRPSTRSPGCRHGGFSGKSARPLGE